MRAIDIPGMVFDGFVERADFEPYEVGPGWKAIFLLDQQAIFEYRTSENPMGKFSLLSIWAYHFQPDFRPEYFCKSFFCNPTIEPPFNLTAGPFLDGTFNEDNEPFVTETVKIKYSYEFFDIVLGSSFLLLFEEVKNMALGFTQDYLPGRLRYLAKFMGQGLTPTNIKG